MSKPCVAHSFSSLIQIVLSGIRLANPAVGDPERLKRILADIRTAAAQRAGLTEHLLAFSQDLPTEPKAVDTAEHIRRAVDLFGRSLHGKIRIDIDLEDDLWPVQVDAAQFDLALLNAALNARDAMPDAALAAVATLVGALILARAVDDQELSDRILAASARRLTAGDDGTDAGSPPSR